MSGPQQPGVVLVQGIGPNGQLQLFPLAQGPAPPGSATAAVSGPQPIIQAATAPSVSVAMMPTVSVASGPAPKTSTSSGGGSKKILPKPSKAQGGGRGAKNSGSSPVVVSCAPPTITTMPLTTGAPGPGQPQLVMGPNGTLQLVSLPGMSTPAPQVAAPQQFITSNGQLVQLVTKPTAQPTIQLGPGTPGGPLQLMLRPPMVAVSGASNSTSLAPTSMVTNTPLLSALTTPSTSVVTSSAVRSSLTPNQTFVISPATGTAGTSVASATLPPASTSTIPGGQLIRAGNNQLILTRPPAGGPATIINAQPMTLPTAQSATPTPQLIQIQTPNGPMLVALQATPAPAQPTQSSGAATISFGPGTGLQGLTSPAPTNAHPATSQPSIIFSPGTNTLQLTSPSPTSFPMTAGPSAPQATPSPQTTARSSSKGVNLADLLKETGILPESSPPTSPLTQTGTTNTATDISKIGTDNDPMTLLPQDRSQSLTPQQPSATAQPSAPGQQGTQATQGTPTVFMMPPAGPNQTPNLVMTPAGLTSAPAPQLRLAFTADGSVILQPAPNISLQPAPSIQLPPGATSLPPAVPALPTLPLSGSQLDQNKSKALFDPLKDLGLGSSQPSPDSTTPTLDAVATTTITPSTSSTPAIDAANVKQEPTVATDQKSLVTPTKIKQEMEQDTTPTPLIPITVQSLNANNSTNQKPDQPKLPATVTLKPQAPVVVNGPQIVVGGTTPNQNAVIRIGNCDNAAPAGQFVLTTNQLGALTAQPQIQQVTLTPGPVSVGGGTATPQNQKSERTKKSPTVLDTLKMNQQLAAAEGNKVLITALPQTSTTNASTSQQSTAPTPTLAASVQQNTQQLVNLLKQNNVISSQAGTLQQPIRLLSTSNTVPGQNPTTTFQLGNQLITITTPPGKAPIAISSTVPGPTAPTQTIQLKTQPMFQVVRMQAPQGQAGAIPTATLPTPGASPALAKSSIPSSSSQPKKSPVKSVHQHHQDHEQAKKHRAAKFFEQQLLADQNAALKPDFKSPFKNRSDACKRLLRYHVFNTYLPSTAQLRSVDRDFDQVAKSLLIKKNQLYDRFRRTLLKLSAKSESTSELIMLDKLFVQEETNSLRLDKDVVNQGHQLDLPPPPSHWLQEIHQSLQEEEERFNQSRKRKAVPVDISDHDIDLELAATVSQLRKENEQLMHSNQDQLIDEHELLMSTNSIATAMDQESEATSDEDDDSGSEDEDQDRATSADGDDSNDISKYLDQAGTTMSGDDLSGLYGDLSYDLGGSNSDMGVNNPNGSGVDTTGSFWAPGSASDNSTPWGHNHHPQNHHRFHQDHEADAAVDSILATGPQDEDDYDAITADLSDIANKLEGQPYDHLHQQSHHMNHQTMHHLQHHQTMEQEEDEGDSDEESDDDEDIDEDSQDQSQDFSLDHLTAGPDHQAQPSMAGPDADHVIDHQMQCAIDSILTDNHSYYGGPATGPGPYVSGMGHAMGHHLQHHPNGPGGSSFLSTPMQSSDPMLDEAVKSILS